MQSTDEPIVVRSTCSLCQNYCGLLAHRIGQKVVKLEGDPDNPRNHGHLCAKGLSGFLTLYSSQRIKKPLKRTNSQKGLGVDPKWTEISWEEAIDTVAERLAKVLKENPRRIAINTFDHPAMYGGVQSAWATAISASRIGAGGFLCGTGVHPIIFLNTATFEHTPDTEYAKFLLLLGAQAGSIIHYDTMNAARNIAEKRPGGVKVVSVDPLASYAGSKAEEWIPIRPGTDAAFVLSIANLLVNEYGIYDASFLKEKTNAPYLIRPNGRYAKNPETSKPLVWDAVEGRAKTYDADVTDFALEGSYMVNDEECKPSFQQVKDHLKKYTPEYASQITTIPPEVIRRVAKEMGEAASIGQTITIDGVELPYRPVSVVWYRGISSHKNSFLTSCSAMMLCVLLGAVQVPGAIRGHPPMDEYVTSEGLMAPSSPPTHTMRTMPYPVRPVKKPSSIDAIELFPVAHGTHGVYNYVVSNPERFGYKPAEYPYPEILFIFRANNVENTVSPQMVANVFAKIPFVVAFAVEPDASVNLADIVFPDLHHLERLAETVYNRVDEPGYWYAAKPVVGPPFDPPYDKIVNNAEIFLAIAEKAKFLSEVYRTLNRMWRLEGTQYELNPNGKYTYQELADRYLKKNLGSDKGLDWLLSPNGGLIVFSNSHLEDYKGAFRKGRIHLYYEFLLPAGEEVKRVTKELGLPWDTSDYQPIPDWKPCSSYLKRNDEFDLFITNYKVPILPHGHRTNPLLRSLVASHRLDGVLINPATAAKKGIKEGDEIWIETQRGYKAKAVAMLTERVHPDVLATLQHRISKGVELQETLKMDDDLIGFVNASVDTCQLAKIQKA
ncbi:MAG: molybdopterin-dependent oxidoreductase [Thaumarchaeota archaeon]|nr:molybdopterin-dependent oxidoreductase [Nitrososphaerota archaeon]